MATKASSNQLRRPSTSLNDHRHRPLYLLPILACLCLCRILVYFRWSKNRVLNERKIIFFPWSSPRVPSQCRCLMESQVDVTPPPPCAPTRATSPISAICIWIKRIRPPTTGCKKTVRWLSRYSRTEPSRQAYHRGPIMRSG